MGKVLVSNRYPISFKKLARAFSAPRLTPIAPKALERTSGLANGAAGAYSRRQLLANAAIAASRVGP
jgi:prolyl-tRNA editing enzyme YbaK/EbsC (Cys-tRNA(Pro) deacylase)